MNIINEKISLPNGKEISIETGKLAKQADGSVVVRMGDTMILATAVANVDVRDVGGANSGTIKQNLVFPEALSDSECITLTS